MSTHLLVKLISLEALFCLGLCGNRELIDFFSIPIHLPSSQCSLAKLRSHFIDFVMRRFVCKGVSTSAVPPRWDHSSHHLRSETSSHSLEIWFDTSVTASSMKTFLVAVIVGVAPLIWDCLFLLETIPGSWLVAQVAEVPPVRLSTVTVGAGQGRGIRTGTVSRFIFVPFLLSQNLSISSFLSVGCSMHVTSARISAGIPMKLRRSCWSVGGCLACTESAAPLPVAIARCHLVTYPLSAKSEPALSHQQLHQMRRGSVYRPKISINRTQKSKVSNCMIARALERIVCCVSMLFTNFASSIFCSLQT